MPYPRRFRVDRQPNRIINEGNELEYEVPDLTVRNYFIEATAGKEEEIAVVLGRLGVVGVEVEQLAAPLTIP